MSQWPNPSASAAAAVITDVADICCLHCSCSSSCELSVSRKKNQYKKIPTTDASQWPNPSASAGAAVITDVAAAADIALCHHHCCPCSLTVKIN
jgi:hypothetical protein